MMSPLRPFLAACLLLIPVSCGATDGESGASARRAIRETTVTLEALTQDEINRAPEAASYLGAPSDEYDPKLRERITDRSQAAYERARMQRLEAIEALDRTGIAPASSRYRQWFDIARAAYLRLEAVAALGVGRASLSEISPYAVDPFGGAYIETPLLLTDFHDVRTEADAETYLARLAKLGGEIEDERIRLRTEALSGRLMPVSLLEVVEARAASIAGVPAETHLIAVNLDTWLETSDMPPEQAQAYSRRAREILGSDTLPAYARLRATLNALKLSAPAEPGLWARNDDNAYYSAALRYHTTRDVDISALRAEAQTIATALRSDLLNRLEVQGFAEGGLAERLGARREMRAEEALAEAAAAVPVAEEESAPPPAGPAAMLQSELFDWRSRSRALIEDMPDAPLSVSEASALSALVNGPIHYQRAALDQTAPARLLLNPEAFQDAPDLMRGLAVSYAWPGTHMALSLSARQSDRPVLIDMISHTAFTEGWRAYGLELAVQSGMAADDEELATGIARARILMAASAVADIDLHLNQTPRDKAISYLVDMTGISSGLAAERVDRISARPGEAASAIAGLMTFRLLKQRAESVLNDAFSLAAFHDAVIAPGPRPLDMLEADIETWYEDRL